MAITSGDYMKGQEGKDSTIFYWIRYNFPILCYVLVLVFYERNIAKDRKKVIPVNSLLSFDYKINNVFLYFFY